ncbi:hypothetical protein D030_5481A, partial [Vibrio parahaemolyticus AQ3810]
MYFDALNSGVVS